MDHTNYEPSTSSPSTTEPQNDIQSEEENYLSDSFSQTSDIIRLKDSLNESPHKILSLLAKCDHFQAVYKLMQISPSMQYQLLNSYPSWLLAVKDQLKELQSIGIDWNMLELMGLNQSIAIAFSDNNGMGNKNLSDHDSPTISSNNLSIPNQSSRAVYADLPKQKIVNQTLQDGRMNEPPLKNQIQKLSIGMDAVQKQIHDIKAKIYAIEKTVHKKEQSKNELLTYRELTKKRLSTLKSLESSYGSELKVVLDQLKVLLNQKQLFERNINRVQEESKSAESSLHSSNLKIALVDSAILKLNSSLTENQSKIDKLKSLLNTNRAIIVEKRRATQDQLKKSLDTVNHFDHSKKRERQMPYSIDTVSIVDYYHEVRTNLLHLQNDLVLFPERWVQELRLLNKESFLDLNLSSAISNDLDYIVYTSKNTSQLLCTKELLGQSCNEINCNAAHINDSKMSNELWLFKQLLNYAISGYPHQANVLQSIDFSSFALFLNDPNNSTFIQEFIEEFQSKAVAESLKTVISTQRLDMPVSPPLFLSDYLLDFTKKGEEPFRYFETECSLKVQLEQNTLQPELWIKYALSGSSGIFEIGKTKNVEEVLSLLSQGISANPTSTKLWTVYLELTKQCQKSKPEEVRVIFRDAILNLPDSVHIQWQLYLWETQEDRKVDVLYTIIRIICKKNVVTKGDSLMLLSAFVQLIQHKQKDVNEYLLSEFQGSLLREFQFDLFGKSILGVLSHHHYVVLFLVFIVYLNHGHIPPSLFFEYPFNFMVNPRLFQIKWDEKKMYPKDLEIMFQHTVERLKSAGDKLLIYAIIRNQCKYLFKCMGWKPETIVKHLLAILDSIYSYSGFVSLMVEYLMYDNKLDGAFGVLKTALKNTPDDFALWNQAIQLCILHKPVNLRAWVEESIRICFSNIENHSVCVKDLYLIALGFEKLPDGLKLRFPVQDISANAYVWIHYFTLIGMEDASCFQALVELVLADSTILKLPRDTQLCLLNLMIEFAAQYQQGCDSTKLVQLFYRLYKILPVSQIYPADIGMVFGEHLLSEMKSSIIEIDATRIFNKIPLSVGEEVANQLMNLECKIAFPVSFIQNLLDKDRINSAKQILVYSLNRNPTNPYYWKLLIHLNGGEDTQLGNSLWNLSKLYLISPFQS